MFCKNCGNKLKESDKFCTKCGKSIQEDSTKLKEVEQQKWWFRLAKVVYVGMYIPVLILVPIVWIENIPYYSSYSGVQYGSYVDAFWYSLLTLTIYVVAMRLLKISFLYIAFAQKTEWKREFKKLF